MKGATQCARRTRQLFRTLRTKLGRVNRPQTGDPITQLILGVFTRDAQEPKAREALESLKARVVDYNELRVIPALEMSEYIGEYPDVRTKCEDVSRALNRIFAIEHSVSLERIGAASKTEVNNYLNGIPGLEAYSRARIKLLGLNQHAVPLDEAMWAYARQQEVVDQSCSLDEAQAFLERQVEDADALEFVALLRKAAWAEFATAVRKGEVTRIRSIPPDRTTRNMLQLIASGGVPEVEPDVDAELGPAEGGEAGDEDGVLVGVGDDQKSEKKSRSRAGKAARPSAKRSSVESKAGSRSSKLAKPARRNAAKVRSA